MIYFLISLNGIQLILYIHLLLRLNKQSSKPALSSEPNTVNLVKENPYLINAVFFINGVYRDAEALRVEVNTMKLNQISIALFKSFYETLEDFITQKMGAVAFCEKLVAIYQDVSNTITVLDTKECSNDLEVMQRIAAMCVWTVNRFKTVETENNVRTDIF